MAQQHVEELAQSFIAALQAVENDVPEAVNRITDLFAANAQLSNPAIEHEGSNRVGREQVSGFWENYRASFQKIRSEFFEITANEHAAGLFWRSTGTHVTGEPVTYEGVSLLNFDDNGKIQRFKGFYDSHQVATKVAA